MNRVRILAYQVFIIALVVNFMGGCGKTKPSILMVVWDAARPDHMTPYGYHRDTTPTLGKIASDATVFDQAISGAPWTVPSVASLFTGLFVHNHKVSYDPVNHSLVLPQSAQTLAEALKNAGYKTALFTAQDIYYKKRGFRQGFDEHAYVREREIVKRCLAFVDSAKGQPTFIVAYWLNPHAPYNPKPQFDIWSDSLAIHINISPSGEGQNVYKNDDINAGRVALTTEQWEQLVNQYDAEILQNDTSLDTLWRGLEERELADKTMFILTADHGEGFNEHPRQRVWHDLPYETILRVPLIIRYPKIFNSERISKTVGLVDLYPTILKIARGKLDHPVNGRDLRAVIKGKAGDMPIVGATHFWRATTFYRGNGKKFMYCRTPPEQPEIYDLEIDPEEQNNLAVQNAELVVDMQRKLEQYMNTTAIEIKGAGEIPATMSDTEMLKALGYVE